MTKGWSWFHWWWWGFGLEHLLSRILGIIWQSNILRGSNIGWNNILCGVGKNILWDILRSDIGCGWQSNILCGTGNNIRRVLLGAEIISCGIILEAILIVCDKVISFVVREINNILCSSNFCRRRRNILRGGTCSNIGQNNILRNTFIDIIQSRNIDFWSQTCPQDDHFGIFQYLLKRGTLLCAKISMFLMMGFYSLSLSSTNK